MAFRAPTLKSKCQTVRPWGGIHYPRPVPWPISSLFKLVMSPPCGAAFWCTKQDKPDIAGPFPPPTLPGIQLTGALGVDMAAVPGLASE